MKYIFFFLFLIFLEGCSTDLSSGSIDGVNPFSASYEIDAFEDEDSQIFIIDEAFKDSSLLNSYEVFSMIGKNSHLELGSFNDFSYTPHKHFFGKDLVQVYWKSKIDGRISLSYLIVNVSETDDPPSLLDDKVSLEDEEVIVNVLSNDIDVDGDQLEVIAVSSVDNIETSISNNRIVLSPTTGFTQGQEAEIEYTVRDDKGLESTAKIMINSEIGEDNLLGLNLVFIGSSTNSEIGSCSENAQTVLDTLNNHLSNDGQSLIKLKLNHCNDTVRDDELYIHCDPRSASCNDFDKIQKDYGELQTVTLVFVNNIQGPVAGIAKMNKLPESNSASVVAEKSSIAKGGAIYTHELGHLFGLDHTQQVGSEKNELILYGSCGQSFNYFQRGYISSLDTTSKYSDGQGVLWDDHQNIMKSEISAGNVDLSFFSDGYKEFFPKAFNCYRARSL